MLQKRNLKRKTECLLIAPQNHALKTNYIKAKIDNIQKNSKCCLCGDRDETINYIISKCIKLEQKEYKSRHAKISSEIFCHSHSNEKSPVRADMKNPQEVK